MANDFLKRLLKVPFAKPRGGIAETDLGVLKVAMLVSAIDGKILPEEYAMFRKLARRCKGGTPEAAEKALDKGLRAAGYLFLKQALLPEKEFVEFFVGEAFASLPTSFPVKDAAAVRRAFVTWISMATCDDDYSGVERACISALLSRFRDVIRDRIRKDIMRARTIAPISESEAEIEAAVERRTDAALSPDFAEVAAATLARMADSESATAAESRLMKMMVVE